MTTIELSAIVIAISLFIQTFMTGIMLVYSKRSVEQVEKSNKNIFGQVKKAKIIHRKDEVDEALNEVTKND